MTNRRTQDLRKRVVRLESAIADAPHPAVARDLECELDECMRMLRMHGE